MLRLVGRLQAVEDGIQSAIVLCPHEDMHTIDLLAVARDAMHKAVMHVWSTTPSLIETQEETHANPRV
jgi:hypothetical protein